VTETLTFNGVRGDTGQYGLRPLAVEALVDGVLGSRHGAARRLQDLRGELIDLDLNEQKGLDIVALLVRDVLRYRGQPADAGSDWPLRTARTLLTILLGDDVTPGEQDVRSLTTRLTQKPVETVLHIARSLNSGQGIALAQWLLSEGPSEDVRRQVASRFDRAVDALRRVYLMPDGVVPVEDGDRLSRAWVGGVMLGLARLPVAALSLQVGGDAVFGPHRRLMRTLRALSHGRGAGSPDVAFASLLEVLSAVNPTTPWHDHVADLGGLLEALTTAAPPMSPVEVQAALLDWINELQRRLTGHLGTVPWVDPTDLAEAGWGIVFPATLPVERQQALEMALGPLLQLRSRQAGGTYKFYAGAQGYRPGDTASIWLGRPPRNVDAANPAAPEQTGVPYYLLLVGSPAEIPFDFQYQLDVQYAVGRLDLGADLAAYANYAKNVVAAERSAAPPGRQLVLFGPDNENDEATFLSANHLIAPLARHLRTRVVDTPWEVLRVAPEHTTKANLTRILRLTTPPALLFSATHGIEFPAGHAKQLSDQGALLCQDWDGEPGEVSPSTYFAARDVTDGLNLSGMIWFAFACFGAGTPERDEYHHAAYAAAPEVIADAPFVASLPKAALALRDRGALAVVGHVDRSWGLSFLSEMQHRPEGMTGCKREHIEVFAAVVERLLEGVPIGAAMDYLDMRHAAIATELAYLYDHIGDPPALADVYRLAELWTAGNDARGYIVLGDPAVRLRGAG